MLSRYNTLLGSAFCAQLLVFGMDDSVSSAYAAAGVAAAAGSWCSQSSDTRPLYETTCRRVVNLIIAHLGVEPGSVSAGSRLVEDLKADSLDCVEIVMAMEEEFSIRVTDEQAAKTLTVGDIVNLVLDIG